MKIYEEVKDAATIGISGHIRPDGDCIGSVMGLYLYLLKKCPDAQIEVFLEQPGEEFSCISRIGDIHTDFATGVEQFDVFIVLDSTKERTGEAQKYFDAAHKRINIDHHVSNLGDGDVNFLDPKASSASELVYGPLRIRKRWIRPLRKPCTSESSMIPGCSSIPTPHRKPCGLQQI